MGRTNEHIELSSVSEGPAPRTKGEQDEGQPKEYLGKYYWSQALAPCQFKSFFWQLGYH